jgi:hypothetical protein
MTKHDADHPDNPSEARATVQPPSLAYEPRILDVFGESLPHLGLVGEEVIAKTVYLAMTSRVLDKPVSVTVKGHSSSGKSYTVEKTVQFFPQGACIVMTAMSERALVYMKEDCKHRTLVIYEAVALREGAQDNLTSYFIRSLLSEGRIEYPVVVRDKDGNFTTDTKVKEGPTNLVFTTTKTQVHAENETRSLSFTTDDSSEQTERVLAATAAESFGDVDFEAWQQLQSWLNDAEHRVVIPFAGALAENIKPVAVRLRRDFRSLLGLTKAHAVLHQASRSKDDQGRIIATLDDYEVVRGLVAGAISEGVGATVPPTVRETVEAVRKLAEEKLSVTATDLAQRLKLDKSAALRRLQMAKDRGFVVNREERRGQPGRWVCGESMPDEIDLLPQPSALAGCTVARRPEGDRAPCRPPPPPHRQTTQQAAVRKVIEAFPGSELVDEYERREVG